MPSGREDSPVPPAVSGARTDEESAVASGILWLSSKGRVTVGMLHTLPKKPWIPKRERPTCRKSGGSSYHDKQQAGVTATETFGDGS